jgi:hypothetical protein
VNVEVVRRGLDAMRRWDVEALFPEFRALAA